MYVFRSQLTYCILLNQTAVMVVKSFPLQIVRAYFQHLQTDYSSLHGLWVNHPIHQILRAIYTESYIIHKHRLSPTCFSGKHGSSGNNTKEYKINTIQTAYAILINNDSTQNSPTTDTGHRELAFWNENMDLDVCCI